MTAPRGKGFYLVAHNDERLLVGFHKSWDEKGGGASTYVIIEKNTGLYMEIDDIVVTAMGPRYRDTATPGIRTGHCTLAEIVPVDRKRPQ